MARFIYFDLGNVLLYFDHRLAARQMAAVAGVSEEQVFEFSFCSDILHRIETGVMSSEMYYECFCEQTSTRPNYALLEHAGRDIFKLNTSIVPLIAGLKAAGHRIGILSNTGASHWNYVSSGQFGMIPKAFDTVVLSYVEGAMKPDAHIYRKAAEAAGVAPEEIFFTDDRPDNIAGAREAGFDAELFTGTLDLHKALRKRGVKTNY